jgi:hypothetical protein
VSNSPIPNAQAAITHKSHPDMPQASLAPAPARATGTGAGHRDRLTA